MKNTFKESIKGFENFCDTKEEQYFVNKYIELTDAFNNYQLKLINENSNFINILIEQKDDTAKVYFNDIVIDIKENAINLVKVFTNNVIKNNKSQLLKKYDSIKYDADNSKINLGFAHIEDIDYLIFYNIIFKTNTPELLIEDMDNYLNSLITEPAFSPKIARKLNR